ncbi:hypothetical protein HDV04_000268 [Boothiomyces sp. JEL0838]|nr:hypothetical protein HDV04_000268 [Boothiomyces sp. JEL0838]
MAPTKYTIEQVLNNELPPPLSYKDFLEFLKDENCPEKLEFIAEVQEYKKAAAQCFDSKATANKINIGKDNLPEDSAVEYKSKSNTDLSKPVNINNIDSKMYEKHLEGLKSKLSKIIDLYVTINSERDLLLPDQIRILCEENLEFLIDVVKYQKAAVKFFPQPVVKGRERGLSTAPPPIYLDRAATVKGDSIQTESEGGSTIEKIASSALPSPQKPDDLTEAEYQEQLSKIKTNILELINKYVKENSHREINLPTTIRRPLLAHIANAKYHPDILNPAYEHIASMLKTNSLIKFLKSGADIVNANNIIEDFLLFLQKQLSEENLKFLLAVSDYEKLARDLFPNPIPLPRMSMIVRGTTVARRDTKLPGVIEEPDIALDKLHFPEKPATLSEEEYQKLLQKVQEAHHLIYEQYISESAPSEINIPTKIKKPLISKLSKNVLHPDIYRESKKHIFDMIQQNNLAKFLKSTYKDGISKGFSEYCFELGCQTELEFLRSIVQYQKVASQVFTMSNPHGRRRESSSATITGPSTTPLNSVDGRDSVSNNSNEALYTAQPKKPTNMKTQDYEVLVKKIEFMFSEIVHQYLRAQDSKLLIPSELSKPLLLKFERRQYHPDIFTKCYDCFAHDLNVKAWWGYEQKMEELICKEGSSTLKLDSIQKYTLKQLINNELPSPYSYNGKFYVTVDFLGFLKRELCEENLEFLKAAMKYQHEATPLYPHPIMKPVKKIQPKELKRDPSHVEDSPVVRGADFNSQSLAENPAHSLEIVVPKAVMPPYLTQAEFEVRKQHLKEMITDIVDMFMKADSIREINLPTNIRKPFFKLYDHGLYHPHILNDAIEHVSNMIKTNNLSKFWKFAHENIPKMKFEESLARTNSGVIKSNIKQIVLNELPPPYSVQDFMKFLKTEHTEENLEFLLAVINYHKFASPYYPNPLNLANTSPLTNTGTQKGNEQPSFVLPVQPSTMSGEKYKELMVQLKTMCQSIVDTYIKSESLREINIIERQRKQIVNELSSGNYHPEIWKPTFEHIANLLRTNSLTKFLKAAKI